MACLLPPFYPESSVNLAPASQAFPHPYPPWAGCPSPPEAGKSPSGARDSRAVPSPWRERAGVRVMERAPRGVRAPAARRAGPGAAMRARVGAPARGARPGARPGGRSLPFGPRGMGGAYPGRRKKPRAMWTLAVSRPGARTCPGRGARPAKRPRPFAHQPGSMRSRRERRTCARTSRTTSCSSSISTSWYSTSHRPTVVSHPNVRRPCGTTRRPR
jgi:hypothetical protein